MFRTLFKESQCSESVETPNEGSSHKNADQFIKSLLKSRLVYRIFQNPIGRIQISSSQKYSVRGFFLSSHGNKYRFLTQMPVKQHWRYDAKVEN